MQLEAVGTVTMSSLFSEIGGQIDNLNCLERAFLDADAAPNTKSFTNHSNFTVRFNNDAFFAYSYYRT